MSKLIFNSKNIYDASIFYKECSSELEALRLEMEKVIIDIRDAWKGADSDIYIGQYRNYVNYLKNINVFLENKSELLSKASNLHNEVDNELSNQFKRSMVDDEQRDRY